MAVCLSELAQLAAGKLRCLNSYPLIYQVLALLHAIVRSLSRRGQALEDGEAAVQSIKIYIYILGISGLNSGGRV